MDSLALKKGLTQHGVQLSDRQCEQLWIFHELLREENPRLNMTRIHNFETMVRKHYVDSLIVGPMIEKELGSMPQSMLDFGTGAGFPGVPLAIRYPEVKMILNESRANRAAFLREVVNKCGLSGVTVLGQRLLPEQGIVVDAVILRAVGSMRKILERTHFALKRDGMLIFLKGPNCSAEIEEMRMSPSAKLKADVHYRLPHSTDERRLVLFQVRSLAADVIRSESNERFQLFLSLHSNKGIKKHSRALVSGARLVKEALERGIVETLVRAEGDDVQVDFPRVTILSSPLFKQVDVQGTGSPLAVVRVETPADLDALPAGPCFVAPFQDPENLGAALRTGAAFGFPAVLTHESANPFLPRAIRASAGASLSTAIYRGGSLRDVASKLKAAGKTVVLLRSQSKGSQSLLEFQWPRDTALIAGVEGPGLPEDLEGTAVHIPIKDGVESLNAATALAVALYELRRAHFRKT